MVFVIMVLSGLVIGSHFQSGLWCVQMVRAHPLALQSAQLQHLIAEASAAQQGSQDAAPPSQVQSSRSILASRWVLICSSPYLNTYGHVSTGAWQLE